MISILHHAKPQILLVIYADPTPYLVKDRAAEKQHGFSHVTAHKRALQGGVLTNIRIFVTANVKPEREHMKKIVLCAGGKVSIVNLKLLSCPKMF